jgi:hypothetical protein
MSPVLTAAIVFVVATGAILAFALVYAFSSTHRSVSRARAEGRAAVPYWHTDDGLEEERGLVSHERPRRGKVA